MKGSSKLSDIFFSPYRVEMGEGKVPLCQLLKTTVFVILQKATANCAPINTYKDLRKKITKISYFTKNNCIEYIKVYE